MRIQDIRVVIEKGAVSLEQASYIVQRLKRRTKFTIRRIIIARTSSYLYLRYSFEDIPLERLICRDIAG